ncbi:MAG: serine/threonine-protein kinase, partial [Kofleriaceae bacterium]
RRIAGEPLADRIAATPGLAARLALLPNVLAVIDAAAFAHARGVIHRDIKPWNILLGDYGETLLIDWGLARVLDERDAPDVGHGFGTPGFMAPEQARGEEVDARADVHALGATLVYLLTQAPVDDAPLARLGREVPGELRAIVMRAVAPVAADRYRDAGELAADVRRFLTGQLVAAHRYTAWQRVARSVRRHRIAVSAAAIALVAIAIASSVAIVNVVRERDRADAAGRIARDRGDQMLVERASQLAEREPTRAAALLAGLPSGSPYLGRARDIAAVAFAGGIAHGVVAHRGAARAIELAPDGRQLLSTGDDGAVRIHDLALGTSRTVIAGDAQGGNAVWTDAGATITFSTAHALHVVDLASGQLRTLATGVAIAALWRADAHHVRYLDGGTHRLLEQPTSGGPATVIGEDVRAAAGHDRVAIVDEAARLRLIDGARAVVLAAHAPGLGAQVIAIAPDGGEVAAVVDGAVVAWQTATGRELGRWSVGRVHGLFRGPSCWFASGRAGAAIVSSLCGERPIEVLRGDWDGVWSTPAAHAIAFAATDGALAVLDATGLHPLAHHKPGVRAIAGRADSPYLALAHSDGTILWWRVADVAPPPRAIAAGSELIGADRAASFVLAHDELQIVAIDRGTGARRALGDGPILFAGPVDRAGHVVVTRIEGRQPRPAILDTASGRTRVLPAEALVVSDRASGRALFARGREVVEPAAAGDRVVATAAGAITMLAVADRWGAAMSEAHGARRLLRIDLVRGHTSELALWAVPEQLIVAADGTLWLALDHALWSWNGRWLARSVMPSPVTTLVASGRGAAVVLLDHSIWLATPEAVTNRLASGDQRALVFGDRSVVVVEGNERQRLVLASGERTRWPSAGMQTSSAIGDDDRRLDVQLHGADRDWLTSYEDRVPGEAMALRLWLAQATNAAIDPATGALAWPDHAAPDAR